MTDRNANGLANMNKTIRATRRRLGKTSRYHDQPTCHLVHQSFMAGSLLLPVLFKSEAERRRRMRQNATGEARRMRQNATGEARRMRQNATGEAKRMRQNVTGEARRMRQNATGEAKENASERNRRGEADCRGRQNATGEAKRMHLNATGKAEENASERNRRGACYFIHVLQAAITPDNTLIESVHRLLKNACVIVKANFLVSTKHAH